MARQPMVTRTITTTKVNALCVDTEMKTTTEIEITLPRTYADEKSILKAINKSNLVPLPLKVVSVLSVDECETLYGMSEQDFIDHAEILPPRQTADKE